LTFRKFTSNIRPILIKFLGLVLICGFIVLGNFKTIHHGIDLIYGRSLDDYELTPYSFTSGKITSEEYHVAWSHKNYSELSVLLSHDQ
jgi:hypothetical protein